MSKGVMHLVSGLAVLCVTVLGFEGSPSTDCVSLTWNEVADSGRGNTYRLTDSCAELFSCPSGSYCPAGAYITSAGIEDAEDYFVSTWSDDLDRCQVIEGFTADTYSYACECGYGFWCDTDTALPRFCPKDYYCRRPDTIKKCKRDHYCKEGSVFGRRCSAFSSCPRGSNQPEGSGASIVIFLILIFLSFIAFKVYQAVHEKRLDRANQDMEDYLDSLRASAIHTEAEEETNGNILPAKPRPSNEKESVPTEDDKGIMIEFDDIRLTLPNGVTIMRGPSGKLSPGHTTAIMGASGAGKTTIMNLITGKVRKTGGTLRVNGEECESLEKWKSRVAFVPQEDVMHRHLTVLENVEFSANLRLPATLSHEERHDKLIETLVALKLDHIQHSIIGDEFQRGISGGQRKRVNVALELVADPKVCFLDEPTSGLDSVSATELCVMLRQLAEASSLTIAAVIHSPGPATFASFHDFLLLQTGGRPVYIGPMPQVQDYFASIGFVYDPINDEDPLADYIMKAVAGTYKPDLSRAKLKLDDDQEWKHMTGFHELWHMHLGKEPPKADTVDHTEIALQRGTVARYIEIIKEVIYQTFVGYPVQVFRQFCPVVVDKSRPPPSSFRIFYLCYMRACRQIYINFSSFVLSSVVVFFAIGTFTAAISSSTLNVLGGYPEDICLKQYPGLRGQCRSLQSNSYIGALQFVGFIVVAANSAVAAATFGAEQAIYWREASTNLNTPAYFFAKVAADVPMMIVHSLASASGYASGFVSPMTFGELYGGFLVITVFGYLSGYFLSFVLSYSTTGLAGVGWAVFWMLLYGGTTRLMSDSRDSRWVWTLSAGRWVNEAWFDAGTVYPYEKVRQGPEKGEDLFSMSRSKQDYLFFLSYSEALGYAWLTLFVLLFIDLFLITATKLDKKR